MNFDIINFANSQFGAAMIGAAATIFAVRLTIKHEKEKQSIIQLEETKAICGAIKTEIAACLQLYMELGFGLENLPDNKIFETVYWVTEDYFVVFNGNSHQIGKLPQDVREKIILSYVTMKSLLDAFRLNNENIDRIRITIQKLADMHLAEQVDGKLIESCINISLAQYQSSGQWITKQLKEKHLKAKFAANQALEALRDY